MEGHPASNGADIETKLSVRRSSPFYITYVLSPSKPMTRMWGYHIASNDPDIKPVLQFDIPSRFISHCFLFFFSLLIVTYLLLSPQLIWRDIQHLTVLTSKWNSNSTFIHVLHHIFSLFIVTYPASTGPDIKTELSVRRFSTFYITYFLSPSQP